MQNSQFISILQNLRIASFHARDAEALLAQAERRTATKPTNERLWDRRG